MFFKRRHKMTARIRRPIYVEGCDVGKPFEMCSA